jgi:hypothetical protein
MFTHLAASKFLTTNDQCGHGATKRSWVEWAHQLCNSLSMALCGHQRSLTNGVPLQAGRDQVRAANQHEHASMNNRSDHFGNNLANTIAAIENARRHTRVS